MSSDDRHTPLALASRPAWVSSLYDTEDAVQIFGHRREPAPAGTPNGFTIPNSAQMGLRSASMLASTLSKGSLIAGRYRLEEHLGEGGMGCVWSAMHVVTRRAVAIKFLKDAVQHKRDVRQRFFNEASAASSLRHPNVVEIIDVFDLDDQSPVMVMELLQGETLGEKLAHDERLGIEDTAAIMIPVIAAVGSAHALGIVHRDLKPENIFIARSDSGTQVKVLDFGIAKLSAEHCLQVGQSMLVTEAGAVLGTPCYMAPEQLTNEADHRADIWSLGVILYECLSGSRPIEGRTMAEVMVRLLNGAITPLDRLVPELPHDVTVIVEQMLARDVARRTPNLTGLTKILSAYTHVRAAPIESQKMQPSSASAIDSAVAGRKSFEPDSATMPSAREAPPSSGPSAISGQPAPVVRPRWSRRVWVSAAASLCGLGLFAIGAWSRVHSGTPAVDAHRDARSGPQDIARSRTAATSSSPVVPPPAPPPAPLETAASRVPPSDFPAPLPSTRPASASTSGGRRRPAPPAKSEKNDDALFPGRK